MTPLMPCPRCTQALPVTAGFCRRCGLPVRPPPAATAAAVASGRPTGRHRVGPLLILGGAVAVGALLLLAGSLVRITPAPVAVPDAAQATAPAQSSAVTPAPMPSIAVQVRPSSPPPSIYQLSVPSRYPPSIYVPPGYHLDGTRHDDDRYREHR